MSDKKIALGYVRLSWTRENSDANSVQRQRANIQAMAEAKGFEVEWYEDADGHKSGTKVKNRPGWQAVEQRLPAPDVVALIANDLSRMHRKGWRIGQLLDQVEKYGVTLITAAPGKQLDLSTPMGKAIAQLSAIFDEWYAVDIRERALGSIRYRKENGITVGLPPFGTTRNENGFLVPSPEGVWLMRNGDVVKGFVTDEKPEQDAIWRGYFDAARRILELYSEGNRGYIKVSKVVTEEGWWFRDRNGDPAQIGEDDVRRIVANWAEYGGYVSKGKKKAKAKHAKRVNLDKITLNPEKSVFPVELLYKVGETRQERATDPKDHGVAVENYTYPLSRMIRCSHCYDKSLQADDPKLVTRLGGMWGNLGKPRYRHKSGIQCGCTNKSVNAEIVEDEVANLLGSLTISEDDLQIITEIAITETQLNTDINSAEDLEVKKRAAIAKCEKKLRNAKTVFLDGDMDEEEYRRIVEQNKHEIAIWKAKTTDIEQIQVELAMSLNAIHKIAELWQYSDPEDQQGLIQNLFEWIVFDLDTHRITEFKLKAWAERFIMLEGELYEDDGNKKLLDDHQGEYTDMPPTGLEPVFSP